MTVVAIADALLDGAMRTRFHSDPIVQATELLLQERTPRDVAVTIAWDNGKVASVHHGDMGEIQLKPTTATAISAIKPSSTESS